MAVGANAGLLITTGKQNVLVVCIRRQHNSFYNTAVGYAALEQTLHGRKHRSGSVALNDNTTGTDNTALGAYAGDATTTGSDNVAVVVGSIFTYYIRRMYCDWSCCFRKQYFRT